MRSSYSESSDVADQVADLSPLENDYFRFLLKESYSERSDVANLPPLEWQF